MKNIEYIVAIDFGHGETSATKCHVSWGTRIEQLEKPEISRIVLGKDKIVSCIGYTCDGRILIDELALSGDVEKFQIGFKGKPSEMDDDETKCFVDFMNAVYNQIRANDKLLNDDNHVVYIAHPSGWSLNDREDYLELTRKAKIPCAGINLESRAASIYAKAKGTMGIPSNIINNGLLVLDFGSSTLDFTYFKGLNKPVDYGCNLGASIIEKLIFSDALDNTSNKEIILKFFHEYETSEKKCELECRKAKEDFCSKYVNSPETIVCNDVNLGVLYHDFSRPKKSFDILLKRDIIEGLLQKPFEINGRLADFRNHLIEELDYFSKKYVSKEQISGILLTGGASQMYFIQDIIDEYYDLKSFRDNNPSTCIAKGIALIARSDLRTTKERKEIYSEVIDDVKSAINNEYSELIDAVATDISDYVYDDIIIPIFRKWKEYPQYPSAYSSYQYLYQVENKLKDEKGSIRNKSKYIINNQSKLWIEKNIVKTITPKVDALINEYCKEENFKKFNKNVKVHSANYPEIEIEDDIVSDRLIDGINIAGAIIGIIYAIPFYIVLSVINAPLKWLGITDDNDWVEDFCGGIVDGFASIAGDPKHKDYSQNKRDKMFSSLKDKKYEIKQKVKSEVRSNLLSNNEMKEKIESEASKVLKEYVDEAISFARLDIEISNN